MLKLVYDGRPEVKSFEAMAFALSAYRDEGLRLFAYQRPRSLPLLLARFTDQRLRRPSGELMEPHRFILSDGDDGLAFVGFPGAPGALASSAGGFHLEQFTWQSKVVIRFNGGLLSGIEHDAERGLWLLDSQDGLEVPEIMIYCTDWADANGAPLWADPAYALCDAPRSRLSALAG